MAINFGLVDNGPDPSTTIMGLYELGRKQQQELLGQRAFADYASNPNTETLMRLAQFNPEFVIGERRYQSQQGLTKGKQTNEFIANLARNATTPEAWAAGVQVARQRGIDVPPEFEQFNEQNRAALMALGGENQPAPTALERNYQFFEQMRPGGGSQYIDNQLDPLVPVLEYDNSGEAFQTYRPRSQLPRSGAVAPPAAGGGLPPGYTVRPRNGGAAPSGQGGFRP